MERGICKSRDPCIRIAAMLFVEGAHIRGAINGRELTFEISGHLPRFFSPGVLQL